MQTKPDVKIMHFQEFWYFRYMNFLRKLLYPFSLLYGGITSLRNLLYNKGLLKSNEYNLPIICVGNLNTGGSGKSPMIEFLISFLKEDYKVAVLSRGYKRKTDGFIELTAQNTAEEVGDEPLQFKTKFPDVTVAVCADRRKGIEKLQEKAEVILLDDAYQHRKVKPSFNILLTPYNDLYINDYMLPTGNLREPKCGANRADVIIVTKCPDKIAYAKMQEIQFNLNMVPGQKIYFSKIGYSNSIFGRNEELDLDYLTGKKFTLVTGIANPQPFLDFLRSKNFHFEHLKYPDHHYFSDMELDVLSKKEIILTTEKDFMRLQHRLMKHALFYLPIVPIILREQEEFFVETIFDHIERERS